MQINLNNDFRMNDVGATAIDYGLSLCAVPKEKVFSGVEEIYIQNLKIFEVQNILFQRITSCD